jgi:ubiquinone/menaquinone biosynthesis C-methylase UbiE
LKQLKIEVAKDARIADLGCGPAGIFILPIDVQVIVAVDPLIAQYEQDLAHFSRADYPNVTFIHSSIEEWQPDTTIPFTHIFCINAINHVQEIKRGLEQIKRAAGPATTVVITTDAHRSGFLQKIFRLAPGDILHPHQYTLDGYLELCASVGFSKPNKVILLKREAIFDYHALVWEGG